MKTLSKHECRKLLGGKTLCIRSVDWPTDVQLRDTTNGKKFRMSKDEFNRIKEEYKKKLIDDLYDIDYGEGSITEW